MSTPFSLPIHTILDHEGRKIRYQGHLGDNLLSFVDVRTGSPVTVLDPITGAKGMATFEWVAREYAAGRLKRQAPVVVDRQGRHKEIARLDSAACIALDKKSSWRMAWALAAHQAGLTKSDLAFEKFIESKRSQIVSSEKFSPPSPSSLRRHLRRLENVGSSMSVFVSAAGRPNGSSQLSESEDALVHDVALRYWASPSWCIKDAHAILGREWSDLVDAGVAGLSDSVPSYESLRLRIRKLETFETVCARNGKEAAERQFTASGEPVPTTRPFERVYLDGTELEQIATLGDDLKVAGSKLKLVYGFDAFTKFAMPPVVFPGPYREEMSIEAITRIMTPPTELTDEMLEEEPWAAWAFGTPTTLVPDNDRTLVPPGYIPPLAELGPEVELPETYHSDAKASIEAFHKWIKGMLRELPGTVHGRTRYKKIKYDPVADAELSPFQFRRIINQLFWIHNTTPRDDLGGHSPLSLMKSYMLAKGGPVIDDPGHVRRMLSKAHAKKVVLTTNGVEFDGVRYRSDEVTDLLNDNLASTPMGDRLEGTAKCFVEIRTFEGDIDKIEVYNPVRKTFVTLYSTQPAYTCGLSRWEHAEYGRLARLRNEQFKTEEQRRVSRIKSLELIDTEASKLPFKRRAKLAALRDSEQVRILSGERARNGIAKCPGVSPHVSGASLGNLRRSPEAPPPGTGKEHVEGSAAAYGKGGPGVANLGKPSSPLRGPTVSRDWDELGDDLGDDADYD